MYRKHFSNGPREALNDPDRVTSIMDVVQALIQDEKATKEFKREAGRHQYPVNVDPCSVAPTGAHHWIYSSPRRRQCCHCGKK